MKKMNFIIILIITNFITYSQQTNYKRQSLPWYFEFDLRFINKLEKEQNYNKIDELFEDFIKKSEKHEREFYNYIYNERKFLRNSNYYWLNVDPDYLYKNIKESLIDNIGNIINYLPPTISYLLFESEGEGLLSNIDFIKMIKKSNKSEIMIDSMIKIDDDRYSFKIYGIKLNDNYKKENPTIICLQRINSSLYKEMNNQFEVFSILETCRKISNEEIVKSKIHYIGATKEITYGICEHNKIFRISDSYIVKVNNLRVRDIPSLNNSKIIDTLKKEEKVIVIGIGEYEIINDQPGEWVRIKYCDNKIGWSFGAYLSHEIIF